MRQFLKPILWPLAGEGSVSLTDRSQDRQRAVCPASPVSPPSSHPPLALALCVYLKIHSCQESERVKQKKKVCRAPEIILVHLFFWC